MIHVVAFLLLAAASASLALVVQGAAWLALWPALSFGLVSAAYLGLGPRVFGKRPDGTVSRLRSLPLLPYLVLLRGLWRLTRVVRREAPYHTLVPGVLVGRRLLPRELPAGVDCVVDLTCELPEPEPVRSGREYIAVPTLDGTPPDAASLLALVERLERVDGRVYLHCAEGHGRAGTVAVALLIARGLAHDADEALALARTLRPGIRLRPTQLELVRSVEEPLRQRAIGSIFRKMKHRAALGA